MKEILKYVLKEDSFEMMDRQKWFRNQGLTVDEILRAYWSRDSDPKTIGVFDTLDEALEAQKKLDAYTTPFNSNGRYQLYDVRFSYIEYADEYDEDWDKYYGCDFDNYTIQAVEPEEIEEEEE